jgi:UDP-2-acetamido-3-amino-2,3-dideoxy-glucuronate N-acetyltransferase
MTPPSVACIGAGYWGRNFVRNFHALGALASVCEQDAHRAAELSPLYPNVPFTDSVDHVLGMPDVSAVAIATPAETHADLVARALAAGKDVFVEKPLCLSTSEGRALVEEARKARRILMVGHLLWYHPAVLKLKQLVDEGALGRLRYIYSNRLNLGKIRREENILWSFAPHDVSVVLGLVGEMPHSVTAQGGNYSHEQIADVTVSLLSFPSGIKAHVFVSWLHPFKEQKLVVVGDRQIAVFDDMAERDKLVPYPHGIAWRHQIPVVTRAEGQAVPIESTEPLREECRHFLSCVETRSTPRTDGEEGLRVLSVLQQSHEALQAPPGGRDHALAGSDPAKATTSANARAGKSRERDGYFAHESAFIDEHVDIGRGTSVWHVSHVLSHSKIGTDCRIGQNVVIGPKATVGNRLKIQNNVSVYEGVILEDDVFCGPSMVFTNVMNPRSEIPRMSELLTTRVRRGATIGANATIVCGVTIGEYAFVGAGAVVVKDVPDFALVVGNPGRVIGWMCACANRIAFADQGVEGVCQSCNRQYRKSGTLVTPA